MFERIDQFTDRLKVPNGWVLRTKDRTNNLSAAAIGVHTLFISDPLHEWKLDEVQEESGAMKMRTYEKTI